MNEKEFMKQVSAAAMPDFTEVKESCLKMLNEDEEEKQKTLRFAGVVAIATLLVCLFVIPENSLAHGLVEYVKTILNLNGAAIELGDTGEISIKVPADCEEVVYDGVTYLTKSYLSVDALTEDIGVNIYTWGSGSIINDRIMLDVVKNNYGRITLLYDMTADKTTDDAENENTLHLVFVYVYFPLSKTTTFGDLMLMNEQMAFATVDEEGNIEEYRQNTEFELVEQYESNALNTTITVIASKVDTKTSGDLGKIATMDTPYYLYFNLDGMCYQVYCIGTLDMAHEIIENMIIEGKGG